MPQARVELGSGGRSIRFHRETRSHSKNVVSSSLSPSSSLQGKGWSVGVWLGITPDSLNTPKMDGVTRQIEVTLRTETGPCLQTASEQEEKERREKKERERDREIERERETDRV